MFVQRQLYISLAISEILLLISLKELVIYLVLVFMNALLTTTYAFDGIGTPYDSDTMNNKLSLIEENIVITDGSNMKTINIQRKLPQGNTGY